MNSSRILLCVSLLGLTAVAKATAPTTYVANNGLDAADCGSADSPCRTITRALSITPNGGSVAVRPGVYGDTNGDSQLGGLEDEPGTESAVLSIFKPVKLYSTNGAAVTFIRGGFARANVVEISAANVSFGAHDAGFTITGANNGGVVVTGPDKITITGNIAIDNGAYGFGFYSAGTVRAVENIASNNGTVGLAALAGSAILKNNVAVSNDVAGFQLTGATSAHQLLNNTASGNGSGVLIGQGPVRVTGNKLSANNIGISLENLPFDPALPGPLVTRNNIVGNNYGIGVFTFSESARATVRENNIYGSPALEQGVGCGILNNTAFGFTATSNYWGAATGPGAKPADSVCGLVTPSPFAVAPFPTP